MLVVRDGKSSNSNEEDATDEVYEELQDGEVGPQQVGDEDSRDDDGVAHSCSLTQKILVIWAPCLPVTIITKPGDHQDYQHQHLQKIFFSYNLMRIYIILFYRFLMIQDWVALMSKPIALF